MALDLNSLKNLKLPSNLPINTKFLLVLIVSAVGIYYFYNKYSYQPRKKKIEQLNQELIELKNKLAEQQVRMENLQETKRELDSLVVIWRNSQILLPDKKDIPGWFDDMMAASRSAGVNILQFKPLPPKPSSDQKYTEYPFQIKFKATYHSLGAYLAAIANHPRITRVSNLQLTAVGKGGDEPWTLEGTMQISSFVFTISEKSSQQSQSNNHKQ